MNKVYIVHRDVDCEFGEISEVFNSLILYEYEVDIYTIEEYLVEK